MNVLKRSILSTISFTAGYVAFSDVWEENSVHLNTKRIEDQDPKALNSIITNPIFKRFEAQSDRYVSFKKSPLVPKSHHANHVPLGLLFGPAGISIDPVGFQSRDGNELEVFYHLGHRLSNFNNDIHNGLIATLLDETLCFCGFKKLPSKRGVTGRLSIDVKQDIKPGSDVLISCRVKEVKGRKCVIEGEVKQITKNGKAKVMSTAECILVEPKWFKYLSWIPAF